MKSVARLQANNGPTETVPIRARGQRRCHPGSGGLQLTCARPPHYHRANVSLQGTGLQLPYHRVNDRPKCSARRRYLPCTAQLHQLRTLVLSAGTAPPNCTNLLRKRQCGGRSPLFPNAVHSALRLTHARQPPDRWWHARPCAPHCQSGATLIRAGGFLCANLWLQPHHRAALNRSNDQSQNRSAGRFFNELPVYQKCPVPLLRVC